VTTATALSGLHHLKIPLSHLDASLRRYQEVFGAAHLQQFDHFDDDGINRLAKTSRI
jgi:catechol 2,3-dioxygenase-like lactoylglutathione lyase family enzyme